MVEILFLKLQITKKSAKALLYGSQDWIENVQLDILLNLQKISYINKNWIEF